MPVEKVHQRSETTHTLSRSASGPGHQSLVVRRMKMHMGMLGAEGRESTRESQNTQPSELRFRALLGEGLTELELALF